MKLVLIISCLILLPVFFKFFIFFWRFFGFPNFKKSVFFKDSNKRIKIYRGVNLCNYSKYAPDFLPWHTEEDYTRLKKWGFNIVRFLVFWEAIEPKKGQYNLDYIEKVKSHLKILKDLKIDVIIDIHQDLYNRKFSGNGFPDWALPPKEYPFVKQEMWWHNYFQPYVLECYKHFWKNNELKNDYMMFVMKVNEQFCHYSNVIGIDVMNEPFPNFPFIWNFEKKYLNTFYENLSTLAFTVGFDKPLFFESSILTSTGIPTALKKSLFKDAIHFPHYYPPFCHNKGVYNRINKFLAKIALRSKAMEARRFGNPSCIGEFGISPTIPNNEEFISDFVDASEKYHINWMWYSYDKNIHSGQGIIDENKNEMKYLSKLVRIYPQYIAGINPKFHTKNNVFYFECDYDKNATGSTEIFIPDNYQTKIIANEDYTIENSILKINLSKQKRLKIEIHIL
jgi:endoglycosylceramidase